MRQQCEIDTTDISAGAWHDEEPAQAGPEPQIDLDRVVWDPEYRDQVLEDLRMTR